MGGYICKSRCHLSGFKEEYTTTKVHRNAFRNGFFRCRTCDYYIKYDGVHCPCCGVRLARGARNARSKRLLKAGVVRY
jgi:rRNA maturation endonuclease Nob1